MAEGTGARKATERNKAQQIAAAYWARVPHTTYRSDGFGKGDRIDLATAQKMAADNLRRQRLIRPLPTIHL